MARSEASISARFRPFGLGSGQKKRCFGPISAAATRSRQLAPSTVACRHVRRAEGRAHPSRKAIRTRRPRGPVADRRVDQDLRARSDGASMGTRYDTLITALEAVCERQEVGWAPAHRSLRAFGKAVDLSRVPSMRRYRVAARSSSRSSMRSTPTAGCTSPSNWTKRRSWRAGRLSTRRSQRYGRTSSWPTRRPTTAISRANAARSLSRLPRPPTNLDRHGEPELPHEGGRGDVKARLTA